MTKLLSWQKWIVVIIEVIVFVESSFLEHKFALFIDGKLVGYFFGLLLIEGYFLKFFVLLKGGHLCDLDSSGTVREGLEGDLVHFRKTDFD